MEIEFIAVFIPIIAIIGVVIMIIYLRRYTNDERLAMIEKGMSPAELSNARSSTSGPLRFSLLLIGIGLGFIVGYFIDSSTNMNELSYFSMLFIFGGVGLGLSYIIEEKKAKKEDLAR
ncbi:hypothetical protein JMN32_01285 [Fulvivirga sp. 29W222]|uniref:DUF6249 domain-containing protein n=1 Tax=Fulvivirga marina TaxID=2494733 RepID=A0A937FU59_9BACT|nr:DUF6249 domain-containing protein [Fulvivirga marina]MBL6444922.1 hypothetical protein [Fulvivirga marina]